MENGIYGRRKMINYLKRWWLCKLWQHRGMYFEMNDSIKEEMKSIYVYVKKCPLCAKDIVLGLDNKRSVLNGK